MKFHDISLTIAAALLFGGCAHPVGEMTSESPEAPWQQEQPVAAADDVDPGGVFSPNVPVPGVAYAFVAEPEDGPVGTNTLETADPLSLAEALGIALSNNPQTRRAWHVARARAAQVNQARSAYYPQLDFSFQASRQESTFFGGGTGGGGNAGGGGTGGGGAAISGDTSTFNSYGPALSLSWLLYDFGERESSIDAAEAALAAANYSFNQSLQSIMFETAQAYFALAAAEAALEADEAFRENAAATLDAAQRRLDNDLGTRPDVLRARADLRTAEAALAADRADIESARARLARALGVRVDSQLVIRKLNATADLPVPADTISKAIATALRQRPLLKQANAEIEAAEETLDEARASTSPDLVFTADGSWTGYTDDNFDDTHRYSAGLALQWTLFQGFQRRYQIVQRQAELSQARQQAIQNELEVISEVWESYFGWRSAREQLTASAAAVEAREEALEAIRRSYQNGLSDLLDLLTAQQELAEARRQSVDAAAAVGTSRARLAFAVGALEVDNDTGNR
ncbi:MAG: TolC family protein [Opitutales bacterium]